MSSEDQLLDAWAAGDAEAAEALFSRHLGDLVRFFRSKTDDDVEDCVHETLVRVMERRGKLARGSSFRAYMFAVARNLLYERLRKRNRLGDPTTRSLQDLGASPSSIAAARQEQQLLLEGLRRVPLETQILLELFYWEDLTLVELSEVFAIPAGTVKSRLHRGRKELREAIEVAGRDSTALQSTLTRLEDWARSVRAITA